jgi:hypothetical protein
MISARHVTASGRLDEGWLLEGNVIHACVRLGSVATSFAIHVCSRERPQLGAHPIVRVDGEAWAVMPERYVLAFHHRVDALAPIACPIGDILGSEHLALTNCPSDVDEELSRL